MIQEHRRSAGWWIGILSLFLAGCGTCCSAAETANGPAEGPATVTIGTSNTEGLFTVVTDTSANPRIRFNEPKILISGWKVNPYTGSIDELARIVAKLNEVTIREQSVRKRAVRNQLMTELNIAMQNIRRANNTHPVVPSSPDFEKNLAYHKTLIQEFWDISHKIDALEDGDVVVDTPSRPTIEATPVSVVHQGLSGEDLKQIIDAAGAHIVESLKVISDKSQPSYSECMVDDPEPEAVNVQVDTSFGSSFHGVDRLVRILLAVTIVCVLIKALEMAVGIVITVKKQRSK